jgi:hypothetical protein
MLSQGKGRSKDYISPACVAVGNEYLIITGFVCSSPSTLFLPLPLPSKQLAEHATETDRNLFLCAPGRFYNRLVLSEPKSKASQAGGTLASNMIDP